ncbi:GntR family transcriptional regulator [Sciscionella marina]|uniref:GntR family transcriptional regulator n=1 Tax=Sciscionella marina TaxID=508770 RepID=UPI00037333A8|nr:GntR family transcriptional regulator [Sciscionella marina]
MTDSTTTAPAHPYQRLADELREQILKGHFEPGQVLPNGRELAAEHGLSRAPVLRAMQLLRDEGLVHLEHGCPARVKLQPEIHRLARTAIPTPCQDPGTRNPLGESEQPESHVSPTVRIRFQLAGERFAEILGIDPDAEITVREHLQRPGKHAILHTTSRLPRDLTQNTPIERTNSTPDQLYPQLEAAGHTITHYTEEVGARMPTPDELARLGTTNGIPVLTTTRITHSTTRILEVNESTMFADRFRLTYTWPNHTNHQTTEPRPHI